MDPLLNVDLVRVPAGGVDPRLIEGYTNVRLDVVPAGVEANDVLFGERGPAGCGIGSMKLNKENCMHLRFGGGSTGASFADAAFFSSRWRRLNQSLIDWRVFRPASPGSACTKKDLTLVDW